MSIIVPFVDLRAQHEEVRAEIEASIHDIINRSNFIGGSYLTGFERQFAEYLGCQEVIGVANGTDALWLALFASGVRPGDAVVTVPNTFIATIEAITRCGAHPIFIDIDLVTANMDITALQSFLMEECAVDEVNGVVHKQTRRRIAALLPVHLYGLPANMQMLVEVADTYGVPIIEDACQAHGALCRVDGEWKRAGTIGRASAFSFYPGKNLGAMGDGGAVATNDVELAQQIRWLRDHGSGEKYIHITPDGWNSRLDSIQAAVLAIKLKKLDDWNARRRSAAAYYSELLSGFPLSLPIEPEYAEHVYHLYVVRTEEREHIYQEFRARNIGVGLHYPIPLHLQKAYQHLNLAAGSFPNTEQFASTLLSLPMHPGLTRQQIEYVAAAIGEILQISQSSSAAD